MERSGGCMMLLTTLIGPQGGPQVERGPSLAEGTVCLKWRLTGAVSVVICVSWGAD